MRFLALATDYDGTIAHHGDVAPATWRALERLRESGRKLILVTGRELQDLLRVLERPELFDRIVAENGALLYRPDTREEEVLAKPPPPQLLDLLRQRGVKELSAGRVIVATQEPYDHTLLAAIRELGLEFQVIFNKGAVMALPSGVNKATGLHAALAALKLSPHNTVGVGDAENDHAFLEVCECAIAVANALPAIRDKADLVTAGDHGSGVSQLVEDLVATDLAHVSARLRRHDIPVGQTPDGHEIHLPAQGATVLVAGASGGGKSTLVSGLIERLLSRRYQALIIDPEGDYPEIEGSLALGTGQQAPALDELTGALEKPTRTVVANLIAIPLGDRPGFLQPLLHRMMELRQRSGRPHWIILDEAHHVCPRNPERPPAEIPASLHSLLLVTVDPHHVDAAVLRRVDLLFIVGPNPRETIEKFCTATGRTPPAAQFSDLPQGEALIWRPGEEPARFTTLPTRSTRRRHIRKYARGELDEQDSFYFQGAEGKLRLRAHNLHTFLQLAEGIDDQTWVFHLREGDYSRWMRTVLKDAELADAVAAIENDRSDIAARASRQAVREQIEARYTSPE